MQGSVLDNRIFSRYRLHHIIFWLLFGATWYNIFFYMSVDMWTNFCMTALEMATFAAVIYTMNCWLIPKFVYTKKFPAFITLFLITILISSAVNLNTTWYILKDIMSLQSARFWSFSNMSHEVLWLTLMGTAGGAVRFFTDQFKTQLKLELMQKENAENELKFLKAQINPHFLFNCLNNIYFMINRENKDAREYMVKFSEMLRYQLYECNEEYLPIEKEIAYLKNYIETMKIRMGINYNISSGIEENLSGFKVAPLVLAPFVENAFKHVSNHGAGGNLISISLHRSNGSLSLEVTNTFESSFGNEIVNTNGIGLKNVTRRLELMYPGRHTIHITNGRHKYIVKLELNIDNETN